MYIHNGILLSHNKDEILPFATTWMDFEGIMLSKISQKKKDKYHIISLICGIFKKLINKQTNKINDQTKPNKNTHIDIENRVVVTRQGGWAGGG